MTGRTARAVLIESAMEARNRCIAGLLPHGETSPPYGLRRTGRDQPNGPLSPRTIASEERTGRLPSVGPPGPKEMRCQRRPPCAGRNLVFLYNPDHPTFELAPTIDISCHGARVVTKKIWQPNQPVSVRSIRGNLDSHARVVYCQPYRDGSFVIGIEIYDPAGDWTKPSRGKHAG
jgi:hypothetical protein